MMKLLHSLCPNMGFSLTEVYKTSSIGFIFQGSYATFCELNGPSLVRLLFECFTADLLLSILAGTPDVIPGKTTTAASPDPISSTEPAEHSGLDELPFYKDLMSNSGL